MPGHNFTGWTGSGCSGTGTCSISMNQAKSVTANFNYTNPGCGVLNSGYYCSSPRLWVGTSQTSSDCSFVCKSNGYSCCEYRDTGNACYGSYGNLIPVSNLNIYGAMCNI
jgi:hypothetical protein